MSLLADRARERAIEAARDAIGAIRYGDLASAKDLLAEASQRVDTLAELLARQASPTIPEGCAQ